MIQQPLWMNLNVTCHPVNLRASEQVKMLVPMQVIVSGKGECLGLQNIAEIFTLLITIPVDVDYSCCKKATQMI